MQKVILKKMLLIPTRQYNDIYQRSYTLDGSIGTLNKLEYMFKSNGVNLNNTLTDSNIANNLPDLVKVNANPNGKVGIVNGWNTQRLRFLMEVESKVNDNILVSYLQGYSEYHDPSLSGMVDPNMKFIINSITNVTKTVDLSTGRMHTTPRNTFNVISDECGNKQWDVIDDNRSLKLIRPNDIIEDLVSFNMYSDDMFSVVNTVGNVDGMVLTSNRANNDATSFFTKTVNSYIEGKNMSSVSNDAADVLRQASSLTTEHSLYSIPFIYALHKITGAQSPSDFTMATLDTIDHTFGDRTVLVENTHDIVGANIRNQGIMGTNDTASMLQPTPENLKTNMIVNSINSIMLKNLLTSISVTFTNITGEPVVSVEHANSFIEGIDIRGYINKAVSEIKHVLFPKICDHGYTIIEASVNSEILGDTTVTISVNGHPVEVYRYPTFADSLYVPVITDAVNRKLISDDFSNILDITYAV